MKKKTILLVEDEFIIGLDIQKSLLELGYSVPHLVSSGEEAIQKAEELNPDLILMDILLSGIIDGIDVVNKIKEKLDIPVIYLTAHTNDSTFKRARETGPYGYLVKPVGKNDLYMAIETSLHRHAMGIKLRESEEKYRNLIENLNDVVYEIDKNATIIYVSPNIEAISGYTQEDILGKCYFDLLHPDENMEEREEYFKKVLSGEPLINEYRFVAKDGNPVWVRNSGRPVVHDGTVTGVQGILIDITEKKMAEEALRESEEKYRLLADNMSDNIWVVNMDLRFTYVSPSVSRIVGFTDTEYLSMRLEDILTPDSLERTMRAIEEDLARESQKIQVNAQSCEPSGRYRTLELELIHKDGHRVWGEITARFLRDGARKVTGILGSTRDITERKKAERALRESEERFRDISLSMADWIWEVDEKRRYTYVSGNIRQILGYEPDEIIGKTPFDLMPEDEAARIAEIYKKISDEKKPIVDLENWNCTKNGTRKCILTNAVPLLDSNGQLRGYRGVDKDITERKKAEEQLKSSLREKEILLKEIHHRVKNNFQVITSLLRLQRKNIEDDDLLRIFINSENRIRAMALVHERLYQSGDFARIDFSDYISLMAAELFQTHRGDPDKIKLKINAPRIQLGIDQAIPCGLIINELVSNAIKHAFPGELKKKGRIEISLHESGGEVELAVQDNGVGLPEYVDITKSDSLGLEIVHLLAEVQLRGKYELSRKKGTSFTVRFEMEE